ncbi:hypothetical protein [Sphaerospermopsis sp. FACHB-1194]|nr:hypothetical protein [Sphaerospermopsis sp. FACHB-1194]MBD2144539.1 hypothetical protein [Sphaerospermopsis sp. FACHB-1194]
MWRAIAFPVLWVVRAIAFPLLGCRCVSEAYRRYRISDVVVCGCDRFH